MAAQTQTRHIGFIRVDEDLWILHAQAIRQGLADCRILDISQDSSSKSVDIVLSHPNFAEVVLDGAVPRYYCTFSVTDEGTVTRGPIVGK